MRNLKFENAAVVWEQFRRKFMRMKFESLQLQIVGVPFRNECILFMKK